MAEKVVALIRENQFLERDSARLELTGQQQRLRERHVPVIVAVDQQDGRTPAIDRRHWRCLPLQLPRFELRVRRQAVRNRAQQAVHAVEVDADLEQLAVTRKRKRRQISAPTSTPNADVFWIYVTPRGEPASGV